MLSGTVEPGEPGAGNRYATLVVTSTGTEPFDVIFAFGSVCGGGTIDGSAYYKK